MQISLRSHLIAGTAAVVGAGAIAMTPVTGAQLNLPAVQLPSLAQVTLAGFDSPLSELLSTGILAGTYLFDAFQDPADSASWPFSGIEPGSGGAFFVWPGAALTSAALGGYSSVGLVPQVIDDALPIISQLGYNGSDYLDVAVTGLGGAAYLLSEGVWNAAGELLTFKFADAFNTLRTSIANAGSLALSSGAYVLSNVLTRATEVVKYLFSEIPVLVGSTFGQVKVLAQALIKPITNFFQAFGGPNPLQGAWNAVVDGLLGPSGIPGTLLNLSIGAGVQTGPISGNTPQAIEDSIKANFVPSIRTEVQAAVKGVAGALAVSPTTAASVRAGAAKAAAVVEAPVVETPAVEAAPVKAPAIEVPAVEAPSVADIKVETGSGASEAAAPARAAAAEASAPRATKRAERGASARSAASKARSN